MKRRLSEAEALRQNHAAAMAKVRLWETRAEKARQTGRKAQADRCYDKVRDWASKARQIEQVEKLLKRPL